MKRTPTHSQSQPKQTQPGRDRDDADSGDSAAKERETKTPPVEVPTPAHTPSRQHLKPQATNDDASDVDNPLAGQGRTNIESPGGSQRDVLESGQAPVLGLDP